MEDDGNFNDLDFLELLGDELGDEEENFTLSQIADRIELEYITSECMISDFADMTFELNSRHDFRLRVKKQDSVILAWK